MSLATELKYFGAFWDIYIYTPPHSRGLHCYNKKITPNMVYKQSKRESFGRIYFFIFSLISVRIHQPHYLKTNFFNVYSRLQPGNQTFSEAIIVN